MEDLVLHEAISEVRIRARIEIPIKVRGKELPHTTEMVTFFGLHDSEEHLAIVFSDPKGESSSAPLVRIHSECLTGDVFGSRRCDCGPQLDESIDHLSQNGGVLLYLRQEGRGIGLYNKLDTYHLQISLGLDTFAANRAMNFPDDLRDFRVAAEMLIALGITEIVLITNNPDKGTQVAKYGLSVKELIPTGVFANRVNQDYLSAKVKFKNHSINLNEAS